MTQVLRFHEWKHAMLWATDMSAKSNIRYRVNKAAGVWWVKRSTRQWCSECEGRRSYHCVLIGCSIDHRCSGCQGRGWKK